MSGFSGQHPIPRSHLAGLALSTAGSSATFAVAAGQCADSTSAVLMSLAASISKTTSAWALGSGNGGLDTGTIANSTWYHVYLIERIDTGVVDVLVSLSASSPTMPSGYTLSRRIGSMLTDGSAHWTAFVQDGDRFRWNTVINDVSAVNPGTAAVTRTLTVPTGIRVQWDGSAAVITTNGTAGSGGLYLSDLSQSDQAPSSTVFTHVVFFDGTSAGHTLVMGAPVSVMTNASAQIRSRIAISAADLTLSITTHGWFDRRGRDS